jgi:hypothetical protein
MSGSRLRPYVGPLAALLVVLAIGAGTAYAAIPNASGSYYACLVKDTGAVRLINYPKVKTCPDGQRLISWNQQGPAGPQGPQGAQGPAGSAGITRITVTTVPGDFTIPAGDPLGGTPNSGVTVACPAGKVVGGGYSSDSSGNVIVTDSRPDGNGWRVEAANVNGTYAQTVGAYAVCLTTDPAAVIAKVAPAKSGKNHRK